MTKLVNMVILPKIISNISHRDEHHKGSVGGDLSHRYVLVVGRHSYKLRQPLAEPHGYIPVHVDSKWFVAFLQTTDGEVLQGADVLAKIHSPLLTHSQTAYRNKT